eukprot:sb/3466048/
MGTGILKVLRKYQQTSTGSSKSVSNSFTASYRLTNGHFDVHLQLIIEIHIEDVSRRECSTGYQRAENKRKRFKWLRQTNVSLPRRADRQIPVTDDLPSTSTLVTFLISSPLSQSVHVSLSLRLFPSPSDSLSLSLSPSLSLFLSLSHSLSLPLTLNSPSQTISLSLSLSLTLRNSPSQTISLSLPLTLTIPITTKFINIFSMSREIGRERGDSERFQRVKLDLHISSRSVPAVEVKQEPTETSKQSIRTLYIGHMTGYQPIKDQYFLIRSVPESDFLKFTGIYNVSIIASKVKQEPTETSKQSIRTLYIGHVTGYQPIKDQYFLIRSVPEFKLYSKFFSSLIPKCFTQLNQMYIKFQP